MMKKDILVGLLYALIGSVFVSYSTFYEIGTLRNMGTGYFPLIVSLILVFVGAYIIVKSILKK